MLVLIFSLGVVLEASATPGAVKFVFPDKIEAPRWQYDQVQKKSMKGLSRDLMQIKESSQQEKFQDCLKQIKKIKAKAKSVRPWLQNEEGRCALGLKPGAAQMRALNDWLRGLNEEQLYAGAAAEDLQTLYGDGLLQLLEQQALLERKSISGTISRLSQWQERLTPEQSFRFFKLAGESAFVDQNKDAAEAFFRRALNVREDKDIRTRLESLQSGKKKESPAATVPTPVADPDLGLSDAEREVVTRMRTAIGNGDWLGAIEDGVYIIQKFPGSEKAKWATDRILEIYLNIAARDEEGFALIRSKAVDEMAKADGQRVLRWANNAYAKGLYEDAQELAEASFERLKGQVDSTKALALAAASAAAAGQYDTSLKYHEKLMLEHFGSAESIESIFRLGLIRFRQGDFKGAAAFMERLLALPQSEDFEYRALYWRWRALQKAKSDLATEPLAKLLEKYPITYYGLRARAESQKDILKWDRDSKLKLDTKLWMTSVERDSFLRAEQLLKAGWFKEARAEMNTWPKPQTVEERVVMAQYRAAAFDYQVAFDWIQRVWEEQPAWTDAKILRLIFPKEFSSLVMQESKAHGVEPHLVWSVMRQESSFNREAVSSARATGLMQVILPTAEEAARQLRMDKSIQLPEDLTRPEVNIRLGSYYLGRLLRSYKGNVALTLAGYNAGPGRMKKWLNSRAELFNASEQATLSAETDLWVDELPWSETSFYVKAVLRNYLVYRMLDESEVRLSTLFKMP